MLIDSHLHLSKNDYDNIDEIILNAKKNNVNYLLISCCSMADIEEGIDLINKYDNIFLSIGLHPSEAKDYSQDDIDKIRQLSLSDNRVVAIGEIGLDYYYGKDDKDLQINLLIKQLELAQELSLPVVIHVRNATEDMVNILKNYNLKGVIHCFNGSLETANIYIKMGYKLGVGGVLTFKNSKLEDVIKDISLSNILLETDSPYLSPEPLRGTKNEPANVKYVCRKLALIKETSYEVVEKITFQKTVDIFDLNKVL